MAFMQSFEMPWLKNIHVLEISFLFEISENVELWVYIYINFSSVQAKPLQNSYLLKKLKTVTIPS